MITPVQWKEIELALRASWKRLIDEEWLALLEQSSGSFRSMLGAAASDRAEKRLKPHIQA